MFRTPFTRPLAATLLVFALPTFAVAQITSYGSEAGWNIFTDGNAGGCFMEQRQGELVVQMGSQSPGTGFVAVYAQEDVGIAQGEPIEVLFTIDGEQFYGTARGVQRDNVDGAYILANNPDFLDAIRGKQTMVVTGQDGNLTEIDLTGTNAAVDQVAACIAASAG